MTSNTDTAIGRPSGSPIFVLGMLQRTGTNHLWDLLGLHPDTELLGPVFEDHLVRWSPHLVSFVDDVTRRWSEDWEVPPSESADLLRSLGDGVVSWLSNHAPNRRVVTKMPSVEQVDRFFDLFPSCSLVVIIRDGRSVCESGVNTFGWSYERAFRRWACAADRVLAAEGRYGDHPSFQVVRYEELIDRPSDVMRSVCATVGLDPERFPYDQIDDVPIRGSSALAAGGGAAVHWKPVERSASFDPRERWRSWDDHRHRRYAAVAGAQHRALGYELIEPGGTDSVRDRLADIRDLLTDAYLEEFRLKLSRTIRAIRRTPKAI